MPVETDILKLLQVFLLLAFLGVTGLFLILSVIHRRRLLGVLVSVPTGTFFGIPARPVVFAAVLLAILGAGILAGATVSPFLIAGYILGAVCWGAATHISTTILVFDYGLVTGLIDRDASLLWNRVEDYFCRDKNRFQDLYVFFYRDERGKQRRFEVAVPRAYVTEFSQVVDDILETRVTARMQRRTTRRAFKGL